MSDEEDKKEVKPKRRRSRSKKPQDYASQVWDKIQAKEAQEAPKAEVVEAVEVVPVVAPVVESVVEAVDVAPVEATPIVVEKAGDEPQVGEVKKRKRRRSRKKKSTATVAVVEAEEALPEVTETVPVAEPEPVIGEPVPVEPVPVEPVAVDPFAVEPAEPEPVVPEPVVAEPFVEPVAPIVEAPVETPVEEPPAEPFVEPAPSAVPINPFAADVADSPWAEPEEPVEAPVEAPIPEPMPVNPFDFSNEPSEEPIETAEPVEPIEPVAPVEPAVMPINPFASDFSQPAAPVAEAVTVEPESEAETVDDTEPVEAEVVETSTPELVEETEEAVANVVASDVGAPKEEFKGEFWHILEQAGITQGVIKGVSIFLVILTLALCTYFFGWYKIFGFSGGDEPIVETPEVTDEVPTGGSTSGIVSSYIFGLEYTDQAKPVIVAEPIGKYGIISGLELAFDLGFQGDLQQKGFIEYVELLRRLKNLTEVDVYKLVDNSVDRRKTVEDLILEMETLSEEGTKVVAKLTGELANLDAKYDSVATTRDGFEQKFFDSLNALKGSQAYEDLNDFIKISNDGTKLKAYHQAEKLLVNAYNRFLLLLRPRLQDIKTNSEALIKGIKIFDVPGSDINAIIKVQP